MRQAIEVLIQYIALHSDALSPRLEENYRVVTISPDALRRESANPPGFGACGRHVLSNHQDVPW